MTDRFLGALALSVVGLVGCGGEENRPAVWSYISPAIIQPNCATSSCHSKAAAVAGLDFSEVEIGWKGLREQKIPDKDARKDAPRPLVTPLNPSQSRVVNMLHGEGASLMPPDRPLALADIKLIEAWVLNGANND